MDKVLGFLRQGMNLTAACRAAGVTRHKIWHLRQRDPHFAAAVKKLMSGVKPLGPSHITLRSKRVTPTPEVQAYWDAWDDAVVAGTIVKRLPEIQATYMEATA